MFTRTLSLIEEYRMINFQTGLGEKPSLGNATHFVCFQSSLEVWHSRSSRIAQTLFPMHMLCKKMDTSQHNIVFQRCLQQELNQIKCPLWYLSRHSEPVKVLLLHVSFVGCWGTTCYTHVIWTCGATLWFIIFNTRVHKGLRDNVKFEISSFAKSTEDIFWDCICTLSHTGSTQEA